MCQQCRRPEESTGDPVWDDDRSPLTRSVPERSGEGAIYSPAYLAAREGNARGTSSEYWMFFTV